jgi:hypothetical protein
MRAEFVPAPPAISDQSWIGFRKPSGNKNCGLELPSITKIQQACQSDLGPGNPIDIDGEVPWHVNTWEHVISPIIQCDWDSRFIEIFVRLDLPHGRRVARLHSICRLPATAPADEQELVHVCDIHQPRGPGEGFLQE